MNVIIATGLYYLIIGIFAPISIHLFYLLLNTSNVPFLNMFIGVSVVLVTIGILTIICGIYLQMISNSKPQNTSSLSFFLSIFTGIFSIAAGILSVYIKSLNTINYELYIIALQFISVFGIFLGPSVLIKAYLRELHAEYKAVVIKQIPGHLSGDWKHYVVAKPLKSNLQEERFWTMGKSEYENLLPGDIITVKNSLIVSFEKSDSER